MKLEQAVKSISVSHTLVLGDILMSTWGYEQTQVDFYEVIQLNTKKSVTIRQIKSQVIEGSTGYHGECVPCPDQYIGEPILKRVCQNNDIKLGSHYANKWDGKPCCFSSWY